MSAVATRPPSAAEHAPTLARVVRDAELLKREIDAEVERARTIDRVVRESGAPLDAFDPLRQNAAYGLRGIRRRFARAHCELIAPSDERYAACRRVHERMVEEECADGPWSDYRKPVEGLAP